MTPNSPQAGSMIEFISSIELYEPTLKESSEAQESKASV